MIFMIHDLANESSRVGVPAAKRLEDVFLDNAAGFLKSPQTHQLCIAVELMMKAAILHGGGTDQTNRRDIRHNLPKAIRGASLAGVVVDPELIAFAVRFSPYYEVHRLDDAPGLETGQFDRLIATARGQLRAVRQLVNGRRSAGV